MLMATAAASSHPTVLPAAAMAVGVFELIVGPQARVARLRLAGLLRQLAAQLLVLIGLGAAPAVVGEFGRFQAVGVLHQFVAAGDWIDGLLCAAMRLHAC